jgi:zinc protease
VLASSNWQEDLLKQLATETAVCRRRAPIDDLPRIEGRTVYLVHKEAAAQSSLRLAHPSLKYDALGDFYLAGLMNFNLGGTFDSRINLNLREDKGYTYGISSGFSGGPELGSFRVGSEVKKEATGAAVSEVLRELENYAASGMTEAEYTYLQNAVGWAMRCVQAPGKLGLLASPAL